jgi:hypothetical protein
LEPCQRSWFIEPALFAGDSGIEHAWLNRQEVMGTIVLSSVRLFFEELVPLGETMNQ